MKKKVLASLLLSTFVLSVGATSASATTAPPVKTTGDAGFVKGDKPETTKPEEGPKDPTVVDPDPDPRPEYGGVYVTHLPNISFGNDNKTSLNTTEYKAEWEKRTKNTGAEEFYMPHSVQVADVSGNAATTWKLTVNQDAPFESADKTAKLENSRIRIYGNTFTSSAYSATDLAGKISGVSLDKKDTATSAAHSVIPVVGDAETELKVLADDEAGFTVNSYTNAVFDTGYLEENYTAATTPNAEKYEGIKLNVPAKDQSQVKVYTTNLTWTLTVEP
ncbi:hypothetical protein ATZ33_08315 [Enterococcus silesiacus]|uniref:WxL domain-containing protein n=1 Tax=Enterococcus silesiacus TaxID=332949 RepID=A0A0S3KBC5_9ENTE|nr:WxL domain-containing protein [Enterococcus silesiacus]ALS01369.1 hypothetical protein ATZ33_08315 [Enterococcus silesiacus]OJG88583.1 hypothetical protein RV15_GL001768 [Enterococcus silesiacus]